MKTDRIPFSATLRYIYVYIHGERERGFFFLNKKLNLYESDKPSTHLWPFEPDGSMHHISYQVTKPSPKAVHAYSLDRASLSTDLSSPKHYCLPSLLRAPGIVALSSTLLLALKFVFVPQIWCKHPSTTWSWSTPLPLLFLRSQFWLLLSGEGQHWVSHKADLRQIISYKCVRITAEFVLSIKLCEIYMCSFSCLFNTKVPISGGNVPFYPSSSIVWRS